MLINCSMVVDYWLVCFHLCSNTYCESSGNYNGDACVLYGGTWIYATNSECSEDTYICDEYHYGDNLLVCEVCDLSGYGGLDISDDMIKGLFSSQFETDGKISCGMSIALRCDDAYDTHEFGGSFESLSSVGEDASNLERLHRNETRADVVSPGDCVQNYIFVYLLMSVNHLLNNRHHLMQVKKDHIGTPDQMKQHG